MGIVTGFVDQLSPLALAAWLFVAELIPNRDAVFTEIAATKDAFLQAADMLADLAANRVVVAVVSAYILYRLYTLLFTPFLRLMRNHEIGYIPDVRQTELERSKVSRSHARHCCAHSSYTHPGGWPPPPHR